MRLSTKIIYTWLGVLAVFAASIAVLPAKDPTLAGFVTYSLQALLFIICVTIVRKEPTPKNKFIFVNFAVFFSLSFACHAYLFIGTGSTREEQFLRLYLNQYVFYGGYFLLLAFAIIYLAIDVLFRDFETYKKYLVTLGIALSFFGYYYAPYFEDPKYTHHTADVLDWKILEKNYTQYELEHGSTPSPATLAAMTELYSWKNGQATGVLFPEEKLARVEALYPYLPSNWMLLVYKPIHLDAIRMCVVCIGFILLFFGYLYMKDPPQGAYIEKIMFLFLVFCSLEILHGWTEIKTIEWEAASGIWTVGQFVSDIVLIIIAGAFSMRLRFITSVKGEFYEQELASSPTAVTRWRDSLDNLVVEKFFNRKLILGRLFVSTDRK